MKQRKFLAIFAMILVLVLALGIFVACDNDKKDDKGNDDDGTAKSYYEISQEIYDANLSEFYDSYQLALAETDTDMRYALMAVAEAKLLQTGTYIPTSSQGGAFAISRVAPYTASTALWGNDSDRFENLVVATEPIKASDRDAMKAKYAELKATGEVAQLDTYAAWAKSYLTGKGYTLKDSYTIAYTADPQTWDILATYRSADAEAIINTYDNLITYDNTGTAKPALATSWDVSADGLTYTFHIREGVMWVDKDGNDIEEVTAQNWVDGLERALTKGKTSYLVEGVVKNAIEFEDGEVEFDEVGVKAVDKYTLQYTLEEPCSYFISMFIYNPLAPFCKSYADSVGDNYGTSPEYIAYCGPYIVTNYTKDNKIVFSANAKYWNKDNINIKTITWLSYAENKDVTKTYNDMKAGTIDGASLNTTTLTTARSEMSDCIYVSGTDATAYGFYVNINRSAYETIQGYGMASSMTDAQKEVSDAAFANTNFRMAIARALNKQTYNAAVYGEAALYSLNNMYTTGTFVSLSKDVTIDINGKSTTFKAGTYYGAIVQAQLDADMGEYAMKVWDPTADSGLGSSSGFDGWYSTDAATHYFERALAELEADGISVSASNPIVIDYPYWDYSYYTARAQALKQQFDEVFGGKVVLNLVSTTDVYGWYYAGYYAEDGRECNYSWYDCSGWGPDYEDPSSFLNTMLPGGDMIKLLGIF